MTADTQLHHERTASEAPSETFGLVLVIAMLFVLGFVVFISG